jgi:uncharacterized protein YkwD
MSGTPPIGPAALPRALPQTLAARRGPSLLVLAVAVAAVIAPAAAPARAQAPAACASAALGLGQAPPAAVETALACLVNTERSARGLAPVERSDQLEVAAQRHAVDMVARGYFAHVSPTGGTVDKRVRRTGYLTAPCWALGEDLGWAPPPVANAGAVVAAWMESPSHRSVLLDPDFRELGIGIVTRAPAGGGSGATFVLELGAMTACEGGARSRAARRAAPRAAPRSRIRVG